MARQLGATVKFVVRLSVEERERLEGIIHRGRHSAQMIMKARILLKADCSEAGLAWTDGEIVAALECGLSTVAHTRQRLVQEGFEAVLQRKHQASSARRRTFDGEAEAKLIALACSAPPSGRARWTLRLLEEKVVELNIVERASDNTIGRTLKKTRSSHICASNG